MTTSKPDEPFERREIIDEPGIVGARWWQESLATPVPRRNVLLGLLVLGGALAGAVAIATCKGSGSSSSEPPEGVAFQPRTALDMQKEYGWDFGARGEALVFDGESTQPFERALLDRMDTDLAPSDPRYARFYVPTLFASTAAKPLSAPAGETAEAAFVPVKDVLKPILTPSMDAAYKQGQALATAVQADKSAKETAFVVDLTGPESIAFAAGAASVLEPIFLFDNWPHPRGVVPAHRTLAAAAYYQPLFAKARTTRASASAGSAPPLFVLDRHRLSTYTDDAKEFDNRHVAKMPSAASLSSLGVKKVVYVDASGRELDDLNDDLVAYAAGGIGVALGRPSLDPGSYASAPPYTPTPRATAFSSGAPPASRSTAPARPRPSNFGTVPVAIAVATGVVLGARASRSGSWNRTPSWSSGS